MAAATAARSHRPSTGPGPCPRPIGLVVKNGSNTRSTYRPSAMPVPVSLTHTETYWPGSSSLCAPCGRRATCCAVSMVMLAAVRHRIARIDAQVQQRVLELVRVDQRRTSSPPAATVSTSIAGPTVRRTSSSKSGQQPVDRRSAFGSSVWRREKASSRWVRPAARARSALAGRQDSARHRAAAPAPGASRSSPTRPRCRPADC